MANKTTLQDRLRAAATGLLTGRTQHSSEATVSPLCRANSIYTGNPYQQYSRQVAETSRKFESRAKWGNQPTRTIIELRAAFIVGGGISAQWADNANTEGPELDYIKEFMRLNRLDAGLHLDWAKESQIEGKFLARLMPSAEGDRQIACRFIPWTQHGYVIVTDPQDYAIYREAVYRVNGGEDWLSGDLNVSNLIANFATLDTKTGEIVRIKEPDFIYATFGGRAHKVNICPTRIGSILRNIEAVDKGLEDWREINRLYGRPTPVFTAETTEQAQAVASYVTSTNWTIGDAVCLGGATFALIGPPTGGMESIREEIVANMKVISSATGIPIHYLGFVDLMSNRSTAEDLSGTVSPATADDRATWQGWYNTMARKVLQKANDLYGMQFDTTAVSVRINELSSSQIAMLEKVYMPLKDAGVFDDEELLRHVPGDIDVDSLLERKKNAREEMMQQTRITPPRRLPIEAAQEDDEEEDPDE